MKQTLILSLHMALMKETECFLLLRRGGARIDLRVR
jgi:hypothetical protein